MRPGFVVQRHSLATMKLSAAFLPFALAFSAWAEAGAAWLKLLVVAVLYSFGLESHVGADKLSRFFKLIRIDTHVGVSPTTLRQQLSRMETLLPLFQQQCESSVSTSSRSAVVAMDETFFGDFLILVLMDLSSGYLILEEVSDDRRFDTWF